MKKKNIRDIILVSVGIGLLIIGGSYLLKDYQERNSTVNTMNKLRDKVFYIQDESEEIPYPPGFDMNFARRIDFEQLYRINSEVSRWMYVPNTKIDSVVMQESVVGEYRYDRLSINKKRSSSGTYLIPASPIDEVTGLPAEDAHTLILGHRMNSNNGEWQFSMLPTRWGDVESASKFPYIYMYYLDRVERWSIWSANDALADDPVYQIPYELGSDEYNDLLIHIENTSLYTRFERPNQWRKILVLSTCDFDGTDRSGRFYLTSILDEVYYYDDMDLIDDNDLN